MNISVPISWLKDFLKTEASAEKIAETLSLCSQSVEKIHNAEDDKILEIEITVNRYDCLSVIGVAREAAAILPQFGIKAKFIEPKIPSIPKIKKELKENQLAVKIENHSICPRFTAVLIDSVRVGPSPKWLSERLNKVGVRSLNNVVDISNYLMIETGQPIHTFDFDKILGKKMIMRLSKKGEKVKTLDGIERILAGDDVVIEDGQGRLIDLCGIMGGENSQIDEKTSRVVFFVQAYDPVRIRKTSMSLGLRTEAATRFERGIDLEGIIPVITRGVEMMGQLAGSKVAGKLIDIYPKKQLSPKIKVQFEFIKKMLGVEISNQEIIKILSSLGFKIIKINKDSFQADVPTWRTKDISIPEDIVEEVARLYGYFKLPGRIPPLNETFGLPANPTFKWEEKAKDILKAVGFSETYNFSFISKDLIEKCNLKTENHLKLKNPLTSDLGYMRISLIPSLLTVCSKNTPNFPNIDVFEMANVYLPKDKDLPEEKMKLDGLTNSKNFYQIKGIILELLKELGIFEVKFEPIKNFEIEPYWQENATAQVICKEKILGFVGQISDEIVKKFFLDQKIFGFDLDFEIIGKLASDNKIFTSIPKYPPIIEDLAFVFPGRTYIGHVLRSIKAVDSLIKSVDLIDSFDKTRTFRITYQDPERSLTDEEIKKIRQKIINKIKTRFFAELKQV